MWKAVGIAVIVLSFLAFVQEQISSVRGAGAGNKKVPVTEQTLSKAEQRELNKGFEHLSPVKNLSQGNPDRITNPEVEKRLIATARQVGFPETEIENLLRHAWCESKWDNTAFNNYKGGHFGIMQISAKHWDNPYVGKKMGIQSRRDFIFAMYDIEKNIQAAYLLWEQDMKNPSFPQTIRDGWGPWKATYRCRNSKPTRKNPWPKIITVYQYNSPVTS